MQRADPAPGAAQRLDQPHTDVLLRRATVLSVVVASILIVVKLAAFLVTDSVALLSSLVDSILDALASLVNLVAVRQAMVPADREHRFGHGKAEPLAGLGQAAFIAGSSLFLVFESVRRLLSPVPVEHGAIGVAVMVLSLVLTLMLVAYQRSVMRRVASLAIRADSLHYTSDVVLNLSVIAALLLAMYGGPPASDPLIALGIACWIIRAAWRIAAESFDQLMDRELPDADLERIRGICNAHPGVRSIHELRTRASGRDLFIQLHLEMDPELRLVDAHRFADEVERQLRAAFPNADVIIHEDPAGVESPH
jgi:ferrous-iron efflux pump FieF